MKYYLILPFMLIAGIAVAHADTITGTVTDDTGEAIIGVWA